MLEYNYQNGALEGKIICYLDNGEIDTRKKIELIEYYENGQVERITHLVDGKREGECISFYDEEERISRNYRFFEPVFELSPFLY